MSHPSARVALAGEYLTASFLVQYCDSVIIAPEGHKSDLILDHCGKLYRVQVKTTNSIYKKDNQDYFRWDFRSSYDRKAKSDRYQSNDVDFFALVALPRKFIFFMPLESVTNSLAKKVDELKNIDSVESLQTTLNIINKSPVLNPLDCS